jgi:glyoxylase-like metal-dependent hydrolase (beta-lactamase superfamily II)
VTVTDTAMDMDVPHDRHQWMEPGAYEVEDGVWRIPAALPLDGLRAVNIYALVDHDGLTLIDGGWAVEAGRQTLVRGLAEIGAELGDIRRFLVTHAHRDHYTNAIAVRREFGAAVRLGLGERPTIETLTAPSPPRWTAQFDALRRHGADSVVVALQAAGVTGAAGDLGYDWPDEWISDGQTFQVGDRVLEAIATPGHTRGHLVFVDRASELLFAGDHVLPHITPSVAFEVAPSPLALRDYLGSLRAVRALDDMSLLPAHGPLGARSHARIDELLAHHHSRLAEMADLLSPDGSTAYEVASLVGWTSRRRKFADLDPFNQMLAVYETALHLELLVDQARAAKRDDDGVRLYMCSAPSP